MHELALFAGAGGGILGGKILGWQTVCAVERDAYASAVLAQRQNDGHLEPFPIWSDVTTFDGHPWRGIVDVISGGFPCQDISCAGKGAGINGTRSGLWAEMARIIGEVRPGFVFVENSPMLVSRGLTTVLGDLTALGYDSRWCVLGADDVGAPHIRKRIWILADTNGAGQQKQRRTEPSQPEECSAEHSCKDVADGSCKLPHRTGGARPAGRGKFTDGGQWPTEPLLGRVAHGVANRVDRLRAIGNGQVSRVAATAWRILSEGL